MERAPASPARALPARAAGPPAFTWAARRQSRSPARARPAGLQAGARGGPGRRTPGPRRRGASPLAADPSLTLHHGCSTKRPAPEAASSLRSRGAARGAGGGRGGERGGMPLPKHSPGLRHDAPAAGSLTRLPTAPSSAPQTGNKVAESQAAEGAAGAFCRSARANGGRRRRRSARRLPGRRRRRAAREGAAQPGGSAEFAG